MNKPEQKIVNIIHNAIYGPTNKYKPEDEFNYQKLWNIMQNQPKGKEMYDKCHSQLDYIYITGTKLVNQLNAYLNQNYGYQSEHKGNLIHVIKLANELFKDVKIVKHSKYKSSIEKCIEALGRANYSLQMHKSMGLREIKDANRIQPMINTLHDKLRIPDAHKMAALPNKLYIYGNYDLATWRELETPKMADMLEYLQSVWTINS